MTSIYNFSAGPAVLPKEVLEQARDEMLNWHGSGMSIMEMSHRGKEFMGIAAQAEADRHLVAEGHRRGATLLPSEYCRDFCGPQLHLRAAL